MAKISGLKFVETLGRIFKMRNFTGRVGCKKCDRFYENKTSLNRHVKTAHDGLQFSCEFCEKVFTDASALKRHKGNIHGKDVFPCVLCEYVTSCERSLQNHNKQRHVMFECLVGCKRNFLEVGHRNSHMERDHVNCWKCKKNFWEKE